MNKAEAGKLLTYMADAIPGVKISAEKIKITAEAWSTLFSRFPYGLMRQAATVVLGTHEYNCLPTPAALLQAASRIVQADEPDGLTAWGLVLEAIRKFGSYEEAKALAWLPKRASSVARRMGWSELCFTDIDATSVIRGQFLKLYQHDREETKMRALMPALGMKPLAENTEEMIEAGGGE
jgi:hypothetical protein